MRSRSNLPIILAYLTGGLLLLGFFVSQMGGEFFFRPIFHVRAVFASSSELVPGDDVTISGLRVGKVDSLNPLQGGGTEAVLLLHPDYSQLMTDARAVIQTKNLLGERYVDLNPGSGATPLPNWGTIDFDHTLTPVELSQVLDALDPSVRDRLAITINSLGEAVAGRGPDLNTQAGDFQVLASSLQNIATSLVANNSHLDALIVSLRKILETLATWHSQFRDLIANWDQLMQNLAAREQELMGTFRGQDQVMAILNQAFAGSSTQDLHTTLAEAPGALQNVNHYLGNANHTLPPILQESPYIAALFYELASAMSGHQLAADLKTMTNAWRVNLAGGATASAPSQR